MKQHFLHVWHGIDQTIIDNVMMSGMNVFAHVCGQKCGHGEQLL